MSEWARPFHRTHRRLRVWLSLEEWDALMRECQRLAVTPTEWVRRQLARSRAERLSEAQSYVRAVIPEAVAMRAEWACTVLGEAKRQEAQACRLPEDWTRRRALLQEAGQWYDAAAWFKGPLDAYAKLRASETPAPATTPAPSNPKSAAPATHTRPTPPRDGPLTTP